MVMMMVQEGIGVARSVIMVEASFVESASRAP